MSKHHHALIGADQLDGPGEDAVEHDGQVSWVRADQFEDLARRRLECERLAELGVAFIDVDQNAGARDRVARLGSECLQQRDLVVGERFDDRLDHGDPDRGPAGGKGNIGARLEPELPRCVNP